MLLLHAQPLRGLDFSLRQVRHEESLTSQSGSQRAVRIPKVICEVLKASSPATSPWRRPIRIAIVIVATVPPAAATKAAAAAIGPATARLATIPALSWGIAVISIAIVAPALMAYEYIKTYLI